MAAEQRVVLDCRWLGIGGPGRATELVLRGLATEPPPGRWVLWGPEAATSALAWTGSEVSPIAADPRLLLGQRHAFAIPDGDFFIFMHQQRPLRNLPAATLIHDTIPLRYRSGRAQSAARRWFLRRVARTSRPILTISEYSKACIRRDLGVSEHDIELLRFPFDDPFSSRVFQLRNEAPRIDVALFIGAFLPHKNVPRLLAAFVDTEFCRHGGRLVLVGATSRQAGRLADTLDARQRESVTIRHSCTQAEIEWLYATSLFLVQPSLEEGFGLPVWEAMSCGLPVCVSDGGALPEITSGFAEPFPARSVPKMAAAIDACARHARSLDDRHARAQAALMQQRCPTFRDFGSQIRAIVEKHVAATS